MKIAVSVPDELFAQVERLVQRSRRSRSEVYSAALREYVARHGPDEVTDALDRVIEGIPQTPAERLFPDESARRVLQGHGVVISQGEVWWADLADPAGSEPGFRRPVVVVQGDAFNRSGLRTVVCVPLTSNVRWADAPGNALLTSRETRLAQDSVAMVSRVVALDRASLTERIGKLPAAKLELVIACIDVVLGRA